ncbi:ADP-ribosylglycohydrolase family protein [Amycolatopsis sp.]|uniref:ADP-ribosylglycohydrolase family protein n=1 Tax=Amycolatopsis sp. TaxID=37632 RepID=UPI002E0BAB0A|nr:ADP-ribosylglycohydrolase family protein [Amycolatopsis sp.]
MEAAEAVAKVEPWLRAHGMDEVRVDAGGVRRIPEGWLVPYNTVAYLDEGLSDKQIFPPPSLIVRVPEGDLRQAHPHPGGLSIPVTYPGQESWREIVDPDYAAAGLGRLGVPSAAVAGWAKYDAEGTKTGEEKPNPEYKVGPIRRGYPAPENTVETLLLFHIAGWLSRERFLIGLTATEVFVPRDVETGKTHPAYWNAKTSELQVFSSPKRLPPNEHGWWKVDLATLATSAGFTPAPNLVIDAGPALSGHKVSGAELVATLERFPRFAPRVDVDGRCPETEEELVTLAADTAERLGLPEPVKPPLSAATKARKRGYELTLDECRKTVVGESWQVSGSEPPADFAANGLAPAYDNDGQVVPRVDTFGKYFAEDLPGYRYGWQRVTGAFVGFAVGEAFGSVFTRPGQIGPLTQQLLFQTEAVIRSPHREDPNAEDQFAEVARNGLLRWLHTQGVPYDKADGWLVKVPELHAQRYPDPALYASIVALSTGEPVTKVTGPTALLSALPAALTEGGPGSGLSGGSREAVRQLAGLIHSGETDLEAATYLTWLLQKALTKDDFSFPVWSLGREVFNTEDPQQQGPAWQQLKAMAEESLPLFTRTGLPELKKVDDIGDGQSTISVLGRAFTAISGYENDPERALLRAVDQSGNTAMTGALVGAMLGARSGIPGLPEKLVEHLELRYAIENLASDAFFHFDRHSALFRYPDDWKQRYPRW